MSDHADTIRRAAQDRYDDEWADALDRALRHVPLILYDEDQKPAERAIGDMLAMMESLEAERQQAIRVRDRANEAFTAQADLRHAAQVRCEQAIDALRPAAELLIYLDKQWFDYHPATRDQVDAAVKLAKDFLVSLGRKP